MQRRPNRTRLGSPNSVVWRAVGPHEWTSGAEKVTTQRPVYVIVPAFDRVEWLQACLLSVLRQTCHDFKLIVVDDGSVTPLVEQPELVEIAADQRVVFLRKPNGGPASARNYGLDTVSHGYVLMLDSDDVLEPTAIENLLNAVRQSRVDFAVGAWASFDTTLDHRRVHVPKARYRDPYANCVHQGGILGSVMIRNDHQARYNKTRMPWEALEFLLDYLASGRSAVYIDDLVVNTRQHNTPERLSIKYDHFEPFVAGSFFAEKKRELIGKLLLNTERECALDWRILASIHSLLRVGRFAEARTLFAEISWDRAYQYPWSRPGSFAWTAKHFGFLGAKSFIAANRLIGRA
jgi:glycosyltransferase involved in cell wall biosynthesis